jgi:hypothetical protein
MREIQKTEIDSNTTLLVVLEDSVEITRIALPSIWAFKNNAISDLDTALTNVNKPALSSEEKTLLQSWMNGV